MTFAATKANISTDFLRRLDAVADGRVPLSDLDGIRFQAQKLRTASRPDYLMVCGIAYSLEGDITKSDEYFDEALRDFGFLPHLVLNAFMTCLQSDRIEKGLEIMKEAAHDFRDIEMLEVSLGVFISSGAYTHARRVAELLDRMTGERYSDMIKNADSAFVEMDVSEGQLLEAVSRLRSLLSDKGYLRPTTSSSFENSPDMGTALVVRIDLPESAEAIYSIEREVNEAMLSSGLAAVERDAFAWFFMPDKEASRARNVG